MFVSFLAFGGVSSKRELNHRATIIHISMMTRRYYLVPAPWLDLDTPDSFFGNWILNLDRDINLVTAVGKHQLYKISLNPNIQKISLKTTGVQGYRQIINMDHSQEEPVTVTKLDRQSSDNVDFLAQALNEIEDDEFQFSCKSIGNEEVYENPFMRNSQEHLFDKSHNRSSALQSDSSSMSFDSGHQEETKLVRPVVCLKGMNNNNYSSNVSSVKFELPPV